MAVILTAKPLEQHFSISNLISRFRSKKRSTRKPREAQTKADSEVDTRPSLIPGALPLVLPEHQQTLAYLGWTTITFPGGSPKPDSSDTSNAIEHDFLALNSGPHPLQVAYESLFAASQAFFDQPDEKKKNWKHKLGSEEGWSKIPGEKEFITLRSLEYCPEVLRGPAKRYWDLMGAHLSNTLGRISTSLGISDEEDKGMRQFVGPCGIMQATDAAKTATMLRLFRYESWEAKVVAEPHADLGLLSVVVGNVPGLEVWDSQGWFDVEREVEKAGMKGASMLAGRQLERLSNGRYPAGGHRVVSYGLPLDSSPSGEPDQATQGDKKYRFSIVFVLRAYEPTIINSDELETDITGKWAFPIQGVTAGEFYEEIRGKHYNINIDMDEREKQRRRIKTTKA